MSKSSVNLDSPDVLRAFRVAMGLELPDGLLEHSGSFGICVEVANGSDSTDLNAQSTEIVDQEVNPSYQGITTVNAANTSSNDSRRGDPSDTMRLLSVQDTSPTETSDATNIGVKTGTTTVSTTAVNTAANTGSTTTTGEEDTAESNSTPQPGGSVHYRTHVDSDALEHTFRPPNGGVRAPQNSPKTVPPSPTPAPQKTVGVFTTEEAHDVVIDIARELAALSERVQARNDMATKNNNLFPHRCQQIPLSATNAVNTSTNRASSQSESPKTGQICSVSTTQGPTKVSNHKSCGMNENLLPPHLRSPKQQSTINPTAASSQQSLSSPHLRAPRQQDGTAPAINTATDDTVSLNSDVHLKLSNEVKQPVVQSTPPQGPSAQHPSSIPDMLKPNREDNETALQTASAPTCLSADVISSEHEDDEKTLQNPSELPSSSINVTESVEKATPRTSLAPSFLDKWGSKENSSSPKAAPSSGKEPENLENQLVFKAWPGQTVRSCPSAQIRTCHIKPLLSSATPTFICNLVFGGALEGVRICTDPESGVTSASIRFLSGDACKRFYDDTANGLPLKLGASSCNSAAWVTLGKEVDVVGGLLAQQIEQGVTRCVRAVPVDVGLEVLEMKRIAVEKGRQLEGFEDGRTPNGARYVVWRFCDVAHAVAFRGVLARNAEFESCNVSFSEDPCALRQGVEES